MLKWANNMINTKKPLMELKKYKMNMSFPERNGGVDLFI